MTQKTRYHFGKRGPAPCSAKIKPCPFADSSPHFDTFKEAQTAYEKKMNKEGRGNIPESSRRGHNKKKLHREKIYGEPIFKFHYKLGFPSEVSPQKYTDIDVPLVWSKHAIEASKDESVRGDIARLNRLNTKDWTLIEMKVRQSDLKVMRLLYESKPNERGYRDSYVVEVEPNAGKPWKVITVWSNAGDDDHRTLDVSKYATPEELPELKEEVKRLKEDSEKPPIEPAPKATPPPAPPSEIPTPKVLARKGLPTAPKPSITPGDLRKLHEKRV